MDGLSGLADILGLGAQQAPAPLWQKVLTGGLFGAGELSNILEEKKRADYQNFVMNLLKNPAELGRMATSAAAPLSQALTQAVTNQVQGDMASRGLAQAPGIFAATESQALAPFVQQNQNTAMQAILQSLGLPAGTFQQPTNMSPALSTFLRSFGTPGGGNASTIPGTSVDWTNYKPLPPQNPIPPGLASIGAVNPTFPNLDYSTGI